MVAETLMLINPKRRSAGRKKPRTAAQKAATKRMVAANRARRSPAKRKSNPIKHRRVTHHAVAAPARRRSRRRHNPISMHKPLAMLMPALMGAGGALVVNAAMNYIPLPTMLTTGKLRYATKFGIALLIGHFGKKFLGHKAVQMAEGAMIVTMTEALKDVVGGATGLQLGDSDGISYISPAQLAAYTDGSVNMGAYLAGATHIGSDEIGNDFDTGAMLTPQGAANFDYNYR